MIVIDSSAVVAILLEEPESARFTHALAHSARPCMSAVNCYETPLVMRRHNGLHAADLVWDFITRYSIEIVPFDDAAARAAAAAYERYGKGVDPKARLNLADCAAYALAKTLDAPLLFKGRDFAATDIRSCL